MKRGVIVLLLLGALLVSPLIQAQEQYQTYSGFDRFTDNVKLVFLGGDNEVRLSLEIREKEVDSAINNIQNQGEENAIKNLERAKKKLQVVQEKVSLNTSEEIKASVKEIINKLNKEEYLPDEFDDYLLEEEKTQLTAVLTEKTFEYCKELAKEDFALMLKEEECNPDTAPAGLEKELEKLKDLQLRMFVQLMLEIRSCIDDPGTCNCEANTDIGEKAKCEKMVALAVKCEYKADETSCDELEAMEPIQGDGFAKSFVPDFLKNLFREKSYMIEYNIEPSDGVPEECWDDNEKPECKQYDYLKETKDDWDEYGNYIGKRPEEKEPTMRESIPQCFDKNDNFLEEKCGKITIVKSKEGLTNYLIEKEIDNIIEEFENKSEQHLMEIRSGWMMVENKWVIDKGQMSSENWTVDEDQVGNRGWEIKEEMNQIKNQIKNITYAAGTGPGGDGSVVIEGDEQGVVINNRDINVVDNVVKTGMDIDVDKIDPDATSKTPVPTDGSICCKKTKYGETRYHWDSEEDCLNPANIKGEVMDNDVCVALGTAILDEEDPESWGSVEGGVPEECVAQGAYDDEACRRIMEMVEICCRKIVDGEVEYGWIPGKTCVSPYGDRVDEEFCLG